MNRIIYYILCIEETQNHIIRDIIYYVSYYILSSVITKCDKKIIYTHTKNIKKEYNIHHDLKTSYDYTRARARLVLNVYRYLHFYIINLPPCRTQRIAGHVVFRYGLDAAA